MPERLKNALPSKPSPGILSTIALLERCAGTARCDLMQVRLLSLDASSWPWLQPLVSPIPSRLLKRPAGLACMILACWSWTVRITV